MNNDNLAAKGRAVSERLAAQGFGRNGQVHEDIPPEEPDNGEPIAGDAPIADDEDFWSSRPVLKHIRAASRARMVGPWAVMGASLARAAAGVPHRIALPPTVGGRMSLNLFVAFVGDSGKGKGAATAAASDAFAWPDVDVLPIGSGEGIGRTFRPHRPDDDTPAPCSSAIFDAAEVDSFDAISGRSGSTLSAELRKVYSGEQLGFANSGKETRIIVPAGSYRACVTIGVQPKRSRALLGAADGGLPQRFLWVPVDDPDAPDATPKWGSSWSNPFASFPTDRTDLEIPDAAKSVIRAHRLAVLRGVEGIDPLDGHALLTRLKVAAALMALDGRSDAVNKQDWNLAGYLMTISNMARRTCIRALEDLKRTANTAAAMAALDRDEITSDAKIRKAKRAILSRLKNNGGQPIRQTEIKRGLAGRVRDEYGPAAAELEAENAIIAGGTDLHPTYQLSTRTNRSTPTDQRK